MTEAPHPQQNLPALLTENSLIFQQTSGFMSNDFQLLSANDQVLGEFKTQGDSVSRMVMGSRYFDLLGPDGLVYLKVNDEVTLGRDRFEIYKGNGEHLASVVQNFTLFKTKVTVEMAQNLTLTLEGNPLSFDFAVMVNNHRAAQVSRAWAGLGKGLLGRSKYQLKLDPQAPADVRLAIFGTVLALDLIRAKAKK
ncbi:LURP-one-related/scramblase family protein [Rothia sp. ZJ932]|uniref:LURP-one-related/scramblase family protein n=1 Tax=Rothia sp. ZJ932 TaxID=2810516 RepID=UPI0019674336|nr:hypothetical protein [Rothia sp. ZJ932]QRZ62334.1 hypothetical protein JR346_04370 [Rothia sp. ZJ932]